MPESLVRVLLRRRLIITPGYESSIPEETVEKYRAFLQSRGIGLEGKHILDFGYGGSLGVATALLKAGAARVTVCDHLPPVDIHMNDALLSSYPEYLDNKDGVVIPRPEWISTFHGDIRHLPTGLSLGPYDLIISSSVYEHLDDVDGITAALAGVLKTGGYALAYIDLRDHYFKYPFEMLRFSEKAWKTWLNPTSNLNRFRFDQYRAVFNRYFSENEFVVVERDEGSFSTAKSRIRPEFLTGNDEVDAITFITVLSKKGG